MESDRQSTPPYFRYTIRLLRHFPNFDHPFIGPLRKRAVSLLQLCEGSRALDAGCGPGGSFTYLRATVRESGGIVGVEISPEVASTARERIAVNNWKNVEVVVGDARRVLLNEKFDGILMFGTPDIYASSEALAQLLRLLNPGRRVVAFGMKLTTRRFGGLVNVLQRFLMKLSFASTPKLTFEPWALLKACCTEIQVQEYFYGCFFLAAGSIHSTLIEPEGDLP